MEASVVVLDRCLAAGLGITFVRFRYLVGSCIDTDVGFTGARSETAGGGGRAISITPEP
eukprot:COSAG02_NODE_53344_length_302_cov_1.004926_2_plen_59_part_00